MARRNPAIRRRGRRSAWNRTRADKTDESSVRNDPAQSRADRITVARPGSQRTKPRRYRSATDLKAISTCSRHGERIRPGQARPVSTRPARYSDAGRSGLAARVPASGSGRLSCRRLAVDRSAQRGRRACASAMTSQFSRWSCQASASSSPTRASQPADWVERSETLDVCMTKPHIGGELGITLIIAKRHRFVKCDFVI